MKPMIELYGLSKSFGKELVLRKITHTFEKGKIHGIIGFNGSGKTVMFKCICGLLKPEEGTILVNGKKIGEQTDFPESLGMIIENPGFLPQISGYENLRRLANLRKQIGAEEIRRAMQKVGLDSDSKKKVGQYSLGMRERLGIAQAIMENPDLLILDEPFNGLDKKGANEICELFAELRKEGKTILFAAHNMPEMEWLCDTICEMDAGILKQIRRTEN